jgi:SAM-dependent methyltransferase
MPNQNIYNDPSFFEGYSRLRWGETGLNKVMEEPAIRSLMPDLTGKRVLDLGCGFGHVARYARRMGAAEVLGVDISNRMIEAARQATDDPAILYSVIAMQDILPMPGQFDVIISSMALQYIDDYAGVVKTMAESLSVGGSFLFSIEHPIYTSLLQGWVVDAAGKRVHWPVDRYHDESERCYTWFVDNVQKYHRTISTYLNTLVDNGLTVRRVLEPEAQPEFLAERPELSDESRRPPLLVVSAQKVA